jgi:hypothetical protein
LHAGAYEHGSIVNATTKAAAGAINLVAVVFVIGNPVDVVEGAVVVLHGIVIIMPEFLQALFLGG